MQRYKIVERHHGDHGWRTEVEPDVLGAYVEHADAQAEIERLRIDLEGARAEWYTLRRLLAEAREERDREGRVVLALARELDQARAARDRLAGEVEAVRASFAEIEKRVLGLHRQPNSQGRTLYEDGRAAGINDAAGVIRTAARAAGSEAG